MAYAGPRPERDPLGGDTCVRRGPAVPVDRLYRTARSSLRALVPRHLRFHWEFQPDLAGMKKRGHQPGGMVSLKRARVTELACHRDVDRCARARWSLPGGRTDIPRRQPRGPDPPPRPDGRAALGTHGRWKSHRPRLGRTLKPPLGQRLRGRVAPGLRSVPACGLRAVRQRPRLGFLPPPARAKPVGPGSGGTMSYRNLPGAARSCPAPPRPRRGRDGRPRVLDPFVTGRSPRSSRLGSEGRLPRPPRP